MSTVTLSIKIDSRLKDALKEEADRDDRSITKHVVRLLKQHFEDTGIDWKKEVDQEPGR
jgi:hypothetical protein